MDEHDELNFIFTAIWLVGFIYAAGLLGTQLKKVVPQEEFAPYTVGLQQTQQQRVSKINSAQKELMRLQKQRIKDRQQLSANFNRR